MVVTAVAEPHQLHALYERTAISKKPEQTIQNDLNQLQNEQQQKLHQAIENARNRLLNQKITDEE